MGSYLRFESNPSPSGKTQQTVIYSNRSGLWLGTIKWYGNWRQYAFYPAKGTIWNPSCLNEVNAEIKRLMSERRTSA